MITKGHCYYLTKYVFSYILMSKQLSLFFFERYCLWANAVRGLTSNSGRSKIMSYKIFKNQRTWTLLLLVIRLCFAINEWHKMPGSCQRTWPVPTCCNLVFHECVVQLHTKHLLFANTPVLTTVSQQNPIWSSECFLEAFVRHKSRK